MRSRFLGWRQKFRHWTPMWNFDGDLKSAQKPARIRISNCKAPVSSTFFLVIKIFLIKCHIGGICQSICQWKSLQVSLIARDSLKTPSRYWFVSDLSNGLEVWWSARRKKVQTALFSQVEFFLTCRFEKVHFVGFDFSQIVSFCHRRRSDIIEWKEQETGNNAFCLVFAWWMGVWIFRCFRVKVLWGLLPQSCSTFPKKMHLLLSKGQVVQKATNHKVKLFVSGTQRHDKEVSLFGSPTTCHMISSAFPSGDKSKFVVSSGVLLMLLLSMWTTTHQFHWLQSCPLRDKVKVAWAFDIQFFHQLIWSFPLFVTVNTWWGSGIELHVHISWWCLLGQKTHRLCMYKLFCRLQIHGIFPLLWGQFIWRTTTADFASLYIYVLSNSAVKAGGRNHSCCGCFGCCCHCCVVHTYCSTTWDGARADTVCVFWFTNDGQTIVDRTRTSG